MAKAKRKFYTANGNETDIFHSYEYGKMKYPQRRALAFDKNFLGELTQRDRYLMQGYAQAKVEEAQAYRFNNRKKR